MFAIEIIVAMEGIIVIKVWHNCFAYLGGFLLSLSVCISTCNGFQHKIYQFSVGAPFTPSVAYLHILLTQPVLPSFGEPSELFCASPCPWPLLGSHLFPFPHLGSIFVSKHLQELLLFTPAGPSRGIDERAGHLL